MSDPKFWDQVRELIRGGEIDVAISAMESWLKGRLDNFPERRISEWLNELVLHSAKFNRVSTETRKGLISSDAEGVALSKLSLNLLRLLKIIETQDQKDPSHSPAFVSQPAIDDNFEKILGTKSHLQMVSWLKRGLECSTAVCRLISGVTRGSGFRIQDDLIVTNNHVISTLEQARQFLAQFFFEEEMNGTIKEPQSVSLDETRFWTSIDLDVTVVGAHFSKTTANNLILPLTLSKPNKPEIGDPVTIIQHPLGGPKQIALTYNNILGLTGDRVHYFTDTLPGSSGSPVFNSRWEIIAVHHAGGVISRTAAGKRRFANEGVLVEAIISVPELRTLIRKQ